MSGQEANLSVQAIENGHALVHPLDWERYLAQRVNIASFARGYEAAAVHFAAAIDDVELSCETDAHPYDVLAAVRTSAGVESKDKP